MKIFKRSWLFTCLLLLAAALCMSAVIGYVGGGYVSASADTEGDTQAENTYVWGSISSSHYTENGITWTYTLDGDSATLTSCGFNESSYAAEITVPSTVDGHTVTTLGAGLFAVYTDWTNSYNNGSYQCNTVLQSVTIPSTVTTIEKRAFYFCLALESITINSDTLTFGESALNTYARSYGSVTDGTVITFTNADLNTVSFSTATSTASVTQINVADSKMLEKFASMFAEGTKACLTGDKSASVYWLRTNEKWYITGTSTYTDDNGITWNVEFGAGEVTLTGYDKKDSAASVEIPAAVTYGNESYEYTVTALGAGLFSVSTDYSTAISAEEYRNTVLTSVTIPEGVTTIGKRAFYFCTALSEITINSTSLTIGEAAFNTYAASSAYGKTTTGTVLTFTALNSLTIGDSTPTKESVSTVYVASSSMYAMIYDLLAEGVNVYIYGTQAYKTKTSEGWSDFAGSAAYEDADSKILWGFEINDSGVTLTSYADNSGDGSADLANITVPAAITFCEATYNVTALGVGLFGSTQAYDASEYYNTVLKTVTIQSSDITINNDVFRYCTALEKVVFNSTTITFANSSERVFSGANSGVVIDMSAATTISGSTSIALPSNAVVYVRSSELQTTLSGIAGTNYIYYVITDGNALSDEVYNGASLYALEQSGSTFMGYSADTSSSSYTVYTAKWDVVTVGSVTATMAYIDSETNALYVKISDTSSFESGVALTVGYSGSSISYLYAGWYSYDGAEYTALSAVPEGEGWVKFINSNILATTYTVTYYSETDKATVSFTSSVDSLNYSGTGFVTTINGKVSTLVCTSVNSQYGFTYNLKNISSGNFSKIIYVKAYYKTLDGAIVYGEEVSFTINDYISN